MRQTRRSLLSAIGVVLPSGLAGSVRADATPVGKAPVLRLRPVEEAVREAFAAQDRASSLGVAGEGRAHPCRRVEVGHSEQVCAGVQGCHNDRPFAGFPAGHLRIVRTGSEPGPILGGVRLYVSTIDIALTGGPAPGAPSRPLDFASLPPAPTFA